MNMKKKILMAGMLMVLTGAMMLPVEVATAEAQEPVFVEVPPVEPQSEEPKKPAEVQMAEESQPSYRNGLAAYITSVNDTVTEADALDMVDCILAEAESNGIDEKLILAVAHTESTYYSDAVSCADYKGLMQTGDVLAEEAGYSPEALFDPEVSIAVGADYISQQMDAFDDDVELALTAYNQGPGTIYEGTYDTAYAEITMERVENIENFLVEGGYLQH